MYQMYVPGTLENTKTVLVNVGTGYYVEKVRNNGHIIIISQVLLALQGFQ